MAKWQVKVIAELTPEGGGDPLTIELENTDVLETPDIVDRETGLEVGKRLLSHLGVAQVSIYREFSEEDIVGGDIGNLEVELEGLEPAPEGRWRKKPGSEFGVH